MKFSKEICVIAITKSRKREIIRGIELPDLEPQNLEKRKITSTWKYWKRTATNK